MAEAVKGVREDVVAQLVDQYVPGGVPEEQWDVAGLGARPSSGTSARRCRSTNGSRPTRPATDRDLRKKIVAALEAAYEQKAGQRRPAGHALHRKGSDAAHARPTLARASGGHGLHAPGNFPAQLRAEESEAGIQARGVRTVLRACSIGSSSTRSTTVSKIQVRSQAEIEREESRAAAAARARAAAAACRGGFADSDGPGSRLGASRCGAPDSAAALDWRPVQRRGRPVAAPVRAPSAQGGAQRAVSLRFGQEIQALPRRPAASERLSEPVFTPRFTSSPACSSTAPAAC